MTGALGRGRSDDRSVGESPQWNKTRRSRFGPPILRVKSLTLDVTDIDSTSQDVVIKDGCAASLHTVNDEVGDTTTHICTSTSTRFTLWEAQPYLVWDSVIDVNTQCVGFSGARCTSPMASLLAVFGPLSPSVGTNRAPWL